MCLHTVEQNYHDTVRILGVDPTKYAWKWVNHGKPQTVPKFAREMTWISTISGCLFLALGTLIFDPQDPMRATGSLDVEGWNFWKRLKSVVGWWMKLRLFLCNLLGPMFVSMSFPCHFFIWEEDPNSLHIWPVHYTSNYCWDGLKPSKSKSLSVRLLQDHMCLSQDIVYFSQEWIVIPLLIGLNIPVISSYKFMRNLIHDGGWPYCIRPL